MNHPNRLRSERQKQYNYMTQQEYENELKQQIEEKKRQKLVDQVQNQQEILQHYKNYQLGAGKEEGENPLYMNDLDNLLRNREKEIEKYAGLLGGNFGAPKSEVFQGDMNAFAQKGNPGLPSGGQNQIFDSRQRDLFDEKFLQNYKESQVMKTNENLNTNNLFGNPNQLSLNFASQIQPTMSSQQQMADNNERERRLKLREMERKKRQDGYEGGGYGQVETASKPIPQNNDTKQNIFGSQNQDNISKRELMWQQKMMQKRGESVDRTRPPVIQELPISQAHNIPIQLPINLNQQNFAPYEQIQNDRVQSSDHLRSSKVGLTLVEARKLDQSINQEQFQQQMNQIGNQKEQPQTDGGSNIFFGGGDNLIQKRRENEKKQRQQEYQDYVKQQQKPQKIGGVDIQMPQASSQPQIVNKPLQQNTYSPPASPKHAQNNVFQAVGMQQLGLHQQQQMDDKQKKQREYKEFLDKQQMAKLSEKDRRNLIGDQVFREVMSSHGRFVPPANNIPQPYQPMQAQDLQKQNTPQRVQSAHHQNQRRVSAQEGIEGAQVQDPFFKNKSPEDEKKKRQLEKQREYAQQLQQQIAQKKESAQNLPPQRRRGTSQSVPQQHPSNISIPEYPPQGQQPYGNQRFSQKEVFDYQQPMNQGFNPMSQMMPQPGAPQQMGYHMPYSQPQIQIPDSYNQGFQPTSQLYIQPQFSNPSSNQVTPTEMQPHQSMMNMQPNNSNQDQQNPQRSKQEEYRRELENQIKLKEEMKKQQKMEKQQYEMKIEQQFYQMNQQQPQPSRQVVAQQQQEVNQMYSQPSTTTPKGGQAAFTRIRTDVSKTINEDEEQKKQLKQIQYQQELQQQMEEKKRLKDAEKRKLKEEDEEQERRIQMERDLLEKKEHQELVKEGKRDPNAPYVDRKKSVKRDQFEPSQENPIVKQQNAANKARDEPFQHQEPFIPKSQIYGQKQEMFRSQESEPINQFAGFNKPSGGLDLPINKKEDIFGSGPYQPREEIFQQREGLFGSQASQGFQPPSQPHSHFEQPNYRMEKLNYDQSNMQNKIVEEQQKMIVMYQQALDQILQFRNQYFEQAMQMRENIVKEREQLIEYEKMKSQQNQEISQIQAVYNQLGSILQGINTSHDQRSQVNTPNTQNQTNQMITPILNPQVQNNLNNLIFQQKEQILRMSQSGGLPLPVSIMGAQQNQKLQQMQPPQFEEQSILEQSLSCDSKLVNIPSNKLQQIAQNPNLFSTWKQEQLNSQSPAQFQQNIGMQQQQQQQFYESGMQKSLAGSSHLVGQFQNSQPTRQIQNSVPKNWQSRPQTSQPPETIQELPNQEDDQMNQSKSFQRNREDEMFERESENKESPQKDIKKKVSNNSDQSAYHSQLMTGANPLNNTSTIKDNMMQIEKIVEQNNQQYQIPQANSQHQQQNPVASPLYQTGKHTLLPTQTQSSFYNQTIHKQKQQEQSQQEELQKQLMRILGQTGKSDNIVPTTNKKQISEEKPVGQRTQQIQNPLQLASQQERMQTLQVHNEEQDMFMQSKINIAESAAGTQEMYDVVEQAIPKFSNMQYPRFKEESSQKIEVKEVQLGKAHIQIAKERASRSNSNEEEDGQDLWNDPDMIPPPVVMQDDEEEDQHNFQIETQSHNNYYASQNYPYDISQAEGTMDNLAKFNPPDNDQYNLGDYSQNEQQFMEESVGGKDYSRPMQSHFQYEESKEANTTKKEQELFEIQKLIQQATDKTKNVLENSDHFKFKIRRGVEEDSQPSTFIKKQNSSSRKNIKIGDPFKIIEQKSSSKNVPRFNEDSRDDNILDNLDKMLNSLQVQQQKCSELTSSFKVLNQNNSKNQLFEGPETNRENTSTGKFRDSNVNEQPIGKYAQMALQHQQNADMSQYKSQKSLGRFAQMASEANNIRDKETIEEVTQKYGGVEENQNFDLPQMNQQILRPVSGKSNSNRYQEGNQSNNNFKRPVYNQQQYYNEQEEEEEEQERETEIRQSGYNLAQEDDTYQ